MLAFSAEKNKRKELISINYRILPLIALILIAGSANAFVSAHIRPAQGEEAMVLYEFEVGSFITQIKNDGNETVPNISLRWDVDEDLAIVGGADNTESRPYRISNLVDLQPGETRQIELKVKPVLVKQDFDETAKMVSLAYGTKTLDFYCGSYVKILKSPLEINAALSPKIISPGEESQVLLNLKNNSGNSMVVYSARLVLPTELYTDEPPLEEITLTPQQEIGNKILRFNSDRAFVGTAKFVLRIEFENETGYHVIDRDFAIESRGLDFGLIGLIILIIVLIGVVLYSKNKNTKTQPKP